MPDKKFLEQYPLYRKFHFKAPTYLRLLPQPAIHMFCPEEKSDQTYTMAYPYLPVNFKPNEMPSETATVVGSITDAVYLCASCNKQFRIFLLRFGSDSNGIYVEKVGQEPSWGITIDATLKKMLGAYADTYQKGLINESQGYGIGSFAYYRRIVEGIIDSLLDAIQDLMTDDDKAAYLKALEQTKNTKVTRDKIDLVKDLLPPILRPDGVNPSSTLHDVFSEGLHNESDEDCLELAAQTREVLVFLISQVDSTKTAGARFTNSMRELLQRRSEKGAKKQ